MGAGWTRRIVVEEWGDGWWRGEGACARGRRLCSRWTRRPNRRRARVRLGQGVELGLALALALALALGLRVGLQMVLQLRLLRLLQLLGRRGQ